MGWWRLLLAAHADGLAGSPSLACIGLGPLAAGRQIAPMAQAPVRTDLLEALDVQRDLTAKVALNLVAAVDDVAQAIDLLLGQVTDPGIRVDVRLGEDLLAGWQTDAEDIGQCDLDPLFARDVDACDTCHGPL